MKIYPIKDEQAAKDTDVGRGGGGGVLYIYGEFCWRLLKCKSIKVLNHILKAV